MTPQLLTLSLVRKMLGMSTSSPIDKPTLLQCLSRPISPTRSPMFFADSLLYIHLWKVSFLINPSIQEANVLIERNCRVGVRVGDAWSVKGRYNFAVKRHDELQWSWNEAKQEKFIDILAVSHSFLIYSIFLNSNTRKTIWNCLWLTWNSKN